MNESKIHENHQGYDGIKVSPVVSAKSQIDNEETAALKKLKLTTKELRQLKLSNAANIIQTVQGLICESGYEA